MPCIIFFSLRGSSQNWKERVTLQSDRWPASRKKAKLKTPSQIHHNRNRNRYTTNNTRTWTKDRSLSHKFLHTLHLQIGISGWLTGHYSFRCQPVDYSNNPRTLRVCVNLTTSRLITILITLVITITIVITIAINSINYYLISAYFGVCACAWKWGFWNGLISHTFIHTYIFIYTYTLWVNSQWIHISNNPLYKYN